MKRRKWVDNYLAILQRRLDYLLNKIENNTASSWDRQEAHALRWSIENLRPLAEGGRPVMRLRKGRWESSATRSEE